MPKDVKLFNSMGRRVETLDPIVPGRVGVYCCGPTVYNYQHIGNLRTYLFEDLLVRSLRRAGYSVQHVMNITDVGHLVSDADDGEDKMLVAAKREGKGSKEIAEYYTEVFFEHCDWLHITRPDFVCKATEHIEEMIALITRLEEKGYAYVSGGNVYFDVLKFERYGSLANLDLEKLKAGARIAVDSKKHSPLDFALWFTKSKFENQELQWDSPWGRGYPGWHIECSAMAMKYLGASFDIHCGGIDHIPVHHTNEIAQSECASGQCFSKIWMHGGFLVVGKDQDKMAKSSGEFLTLDVLTKKGFDPISYRLMCLSGSYRNELSWSWTALESAENALRKLKNTVSESRGTAGGKKSTAYSERGKELLEAFDKEIFNDLNMPNALAVLHRTANDDTLDPAEKIALIEDFDQVLGLGADSWYEESVPEELLRLAEERTAARAAKNWAAADEIRDKITALGFAIEDTAEGTRVRKR